MTSRPAGASWIVFAVVSALFGLLATGPGTASGGLPPVCWDAPRMLYLGAAPPELAERVHLMRVAGGGAGAGGIVVHNPDTTRPGPWRAALDISLSDGDTLRMLLDGVSGPIGPREFGRSLVFLRVSWGRTTFSDLLIDRNGGELIHHEQVIDGTEAWRQARESCALPEMALAAACDCKSDLDPWPRPRVSPGTNSIIGLLVLSDVFGPGETGGVVAADPVIPLPLYATPDAGAEPVRLIDDASELEWREYAYEAGAAVVIGTHEGWYKIRLADGGEGWVRPEHTDRFLPLRELYSSAMTYLTREWSGRLWRKGRGGWRAFDFEREGEHHAEVVAMEALGDTLWMQVVIPETSPCESGGNGSRARGWVPAWNDAGKLNVWFYSRGC